MSNLEDFEAYEKEVRDGYAGHTIDFLMKQYEISVDIKRECDPVALPIIFKRVSIMQKVLLEELDKQGYLQ